MPEEVVIVVMVVVVVIAAAATGSRTDIISSFTLLFLRMLQEAIVTCVVTCVHYILLYKSGSCFAVCTCSFCWSCESPDLNSIMAFRIPSFHTLLGCSRLILRAGVDEMSGVHLSSSFHINPTHLKSSLFSPLFLCIQPSCFIILCSTCL